MISLTEIAAFGTGAVGVLSAAGAWYLNYRKQESTRAMDEQKYDDEQTRLAKDVLVQALTDRVDVLEATQKELVAELKASEAHRVKCELEMQGLKGDMKLMQYKMDRLMKHGDANQEEIATVKNAVIETLIEKTK